MFVRTIAPGTVDVSVVVRIIDSTDGTPELGVVFNTAGMALEYRREGAANVAITEVTLAALTTAHTDGGFLHIGNGYYRVDLPDLACATGASGVLVHGIVTGMVVIGTYIQLQNTLDTVLAQPAQGAPAASVSPADMLRWLYKAWRNKKTNDGTDTKLFNDDTTTVDHKQSTVSSGGTVTAAEWVAGP